MRFRRRLRGCLRCPTCASRVDVREVDVHVDGMGAFGRTSESIWWISEDV